jgi:hypothetical protein
MSRPEVRYFGQKLTQNIPDPIFEFGKKVVWFSKKVVNFGNFLYRIRPSQYDT